MQEIKQKQHPASSFITAHYWCLVEEMNDEVDGDGDEDDDEDEDEGDEGTMTKSEWRSPDDAASDEVEDEDEGEGEGDEDDGDEADEDGATYPSLQPAGRLPLLLPVPSSLSDDCSGCDWESCSSMAWLVRSAAMWRPARMGNKLASSGGAFNISLSAKNT